MRRPHLMSPGREKGKGKGCQAGRAWLARENSHAAADTWNLHACSRGRLMFVRQYLDKWAPPPGLPACPTQGKSNVREHLAVCMCDRGPGPGQDQDSDGPRASHMLFGLGDALVRQIGVGRLVVVRIRRSKFSTRTFPRASTLARMLIRNPLGQLKFPLHSGE